MKKKEYYKKYYEEHYNRIKEYKKKYHEEHRDKELERMKKYYEEHSDGIKEYKKKYHEEHRDKELERMKKYYEEHRDEELERMKKYRETHPEKMKIIYKIKYKKRLIDPKLNLDYRMGIAVRKALKSNKNNRSWKSILPYTLDELKKHIESQFTDGMCWERFDEIHIDHIIPRSVFNYTSEEDEDFKNCWALENLQPLWKEDNLRKYNKLLLEDSKVIELAKKFNKL